MLKQWDLKNRPPLQSEGKFKEKEIQRYIFDGTKYAPITVTPGAF
jgi:hypothetical protein